MLLLISSQTLYPQSDSLIIEHYTVEQGLSNSSVIDIHQDREGYLWFTTRKGVERYDGYSFHSYLNDPEDTTSFINAIASGVYEDKECTLWFATGHGLEKYNRSTNSFTNYLPDHSEHGQILGNTVYGMVEDNQGIFWVITGKGVFKFNKISGKFSQVQYETNSTDSSYSSVFEKYSTLFVDTKGSLWIGTHKGLDKFNYETGKLIHYWRDPEKLERGIASSSKYIIWEICEDYDGNLWLATSNGIVEFDKKSDSFNNYLPDSNTHGPSDVNMVLVVHFDPSGFLWVGTGRGIFTFDTNSKQFVPRFINNSIHGYYLGNNFIQSLYIDHSGALWASTLADGIYKVILQKLPYKRYFQDSVNEMIKGKDGILWIKRGLQGWAKFDTIKDQIKFLNFSEIEKVYQFININLPDTGFTTFYADTTGGIWFGSSVGGLYFFDIQTHKINEVVKTESYVTAILEDASGLVWAGTFMGKLICYNSQNNSVSEFISDPANPSSISGRTIFDIHQDESRNLWFATDAGLNKFVSSTKTFVHFTEKDGFSGNMVSDILEDDQGNLWLATNKGISKFNTVTYKFKNYDVLRGLSSSNWWNDLAVKMDNGEMFFGRSYGLIRFHPDSIKENNYIPPIVITSFRLFDKPVPLGKEVNLTYDNNFLSFEFAALSYYNSQRNQYAYKMENVDENWVYSGTRRYASYPKLAPGKYIFRVKGSNNDGIWNEVGASISIIISPPWWKTTWAYILYGFIFVFTLYGIRRYELNRIKLKDKIKLDAAVLKEREETDKVKSRFFANISHEFRTPLTLILGPAEKIKSQTSEDVVKDSNIITRNSKRLLQLVNQLLDLSKLEAGKLKLETAKGNIVTLVKGIALSFESLSEEKDISLKIDSEKDLIEVYFDREKMIKILSNILSNAFKFTRRNGKITVSINERHAEFISASFLKEEILKQVRDEKLRNFVEIKIKDTGIGIPKEEIPKLFDRFYQVDSSFTKEYQGTGIGLALTKELVELHHGSISVQSEERNPTNGGTGWTEFTLNFPLGKNHLTEEEIIPVEENIKSEEPVSEQEESLFDSIKYNTENEIEINASKEEKTIILVVEDNYDMREYIKESLGDDYFVEEAINGEQGVRKAKEIIPDLIISDIMMPKMDGNELASILKNDERTSHVPIILLTAKSEQGDKIEGLETGADDYLTKPFNTKELQVRIKNLISIRKKLQEKFRKGNYIPAKKGEEKKLSKLDEKFIKKVEEVIEQHISEEEFTIERFGKEVGMSRVQLHRKLKALTGKSASKYLRSVRLSKARKMIKEQKGNISEIAYSTGFSSPAYFTYCFKEEYGYPPSDITK